MPVAAFIAEEDATPPVIPSDDIVVAVETAFDTSPLSASPTWEAVTTYVRAWNTTRGRSYEYDRTEAGQASTVLSNRDRRFDPLNASGDYYPNVKPTRRTRIRATWQSIVYPIFSGFTDGYPQDYPAGGHDSVVSQNATDWFYPLTSIKFSPGSTTLSAAVTTAPVAGTGDTITVTDPTLPMPQAVPFVIQVGDIPNVERMNVVGIDGSTYNVVRGYENTATSTFPIGATAKAENVRFPEQQSGARIEACLDFLGIAAADRNIDAGNTLIAESDDLQGQTVLEHLLLVAECENGRLFAARDGTITFRERHRQFTQQLEPIATFGADAGEIPYLAAGVRFAHDDDKLFNHVRITIADGTIVEAEDQDSIDDHFRRTLDKEWPLASAIEAQDAADYMLSRLKQSQLRLPAITVTPTDSNASTVWPLVLGCELAQRYTFTAAPAIAGSEIVNSEVLVERITHRYTPGRWDVGFEFSEADTTLYWRAGVVGASEIGETTVTAY